MKTKIDINKFKVAPKSLYQDFTLCIYGEIDNEMLFWAKQHGVLLNQTDKYVNFILPENFNCDDAFIQPPNFEWLDGFSPNLNKKLHIGHFSNLVLGKAFQSLGVCKNTVSIYGDTLTGDISNEDGLANLKIYQEKFKFKPSLELMASHVKLIDESILIDGTGDYNGTKIFEINDEKIVAIKSNGQTSYFYQDVALAQKLNSSTLYLTGAEQANHFKNLKELFPNIHHVSLGLVKVSGKKMGTRFGNVILIEDFIKEMNEVLNSEDENLIYNVFAGFILQSNPEVDKKINMDILNNPNNSFGLYLSYTMARLHSAGCEPLYSLENIFHSTELNYAYFKSKTNLKPNILFSAAVELCKDISGLYGTHMIKNNPDNKHMFDKKLGDLHMCFVKLGLFPVFKI